MSRIARLLPRIGLSSLRMPAGHLAKQHIQNNSGNGDAWEVSCTLPHTPQPPKDLGTGLPGAVRKICLFLVNT